ncbi:phospholipase [Lentibacillus sp. CBA3610]|uniref:phospholipase n=1 Tax=Lentibacillus sp. CBA3610 TaxID=2518176 RepID=UPI001595B79A|nr:phospholipase [Lentibacillus sp. CBA3610]QKY71499.1 phospholipase [Lentibacillus sp. CBA3610]
MPQYGQSRPGNCIIPGYRYCGPGCSGPGEPVNAVDAACQAHDVCLERGGSACFCDHEFLQRLRPLINPYTAEGRHARTIHHAMRIAARFRC